MSPDALRSVLDGIPPRSGCGRTAGDSAGALAADWDGRSALALAHPACPPARIAARSNLRASACSDDAFAALAAARGAASWDGRSRQYTSAMTRPAVARLAAGSYTGPDDTSAGPGAWIDYEARDRAALSPACPKAVGGFLAGDQNSRVRAAVAKIPDAAPRLLRLLAADPYESVRKAVADNLNCPPQTLAGLTSTPDAVAWQAVKNPNCPPDAVEYALLDGADHPLRMRAAASAACTPHLIRQACLRPDTWPDTSIPEGLAKNPNCPPPHLADLASHSEFIVRHGVASNPSTPALALRWLLAEKDFPDEMMVALARNPALPEALLEAVADRCGPDEIEAVLKHPRCPAQILQSYASSGDHHHRAAVAAHPATQPSTLESFAVDIDYMVRDALLDNPECPVAVLALLVEDPSSDLPYAAADQIRTRYARHLNDTS